MLTDTHLFVGCLPKLNWWTNFTVSQIKKKYFVLRFSTLKLTVSLLTQNYVTQNFRYYAPELFGRGEPTVAGKMHRIRKCKGTVKNTYIYIFFELALFAKATFRSHLETFTLATFRNTRYLKLL